MFWNEVLISKAKPQERDAIMIYTGSYTAVAIPRNVRASGEHSCMTSASVHEPQILTDTYKWMFLQYFTAAGVHRAKGLERDD